MIDLKLQGHAAQLDFAACRDVPFVGFVGGRSAGKSSAGVLRLARWGLAEPGPYALFAPTYTMLHDTIMPAFLSMAQPILARAPVGNPPNIQLVGGTEIRCRSLDDPERARGGSLRGALWDEASLCAQEAFDIVIACLRYEGHQGWLACTFTPKGLTHWTAKVFNDPARQDVRCFHARTESNPFNPPGFRDRLQAQYTRAFSVQELDGAFINLGGGLIKREWLQIASTAPANLRRVRAWDMAATAPKPGTDPDYTAGVLCGTADGRYWILDVRHIQDTPLAVERMVKSAAAADGTATRIVIEQEPGAAGVNLIDHYRRLVLPGYTLAAARPTGDKVTRAMPFAAAAEAGNVTLVKANWNAAFLDEIESFPEVDHDDQTDAAGMAVNALRDSGSAHVA